MDGPCYCWIHAPAMHSLMAPDQTPTRQKAYQSVRSNSKKPESSQELPFGAAVIHYRLCRRLKPVILCFSWTADVLLMEGVSISMQNFVKQTESDKPSTAQQIGSQGMRVPLLEPKSHSCAGFKGHLHAHVHCIFLLHARCVSRTRCSWSSVLCREQRCVTAKNEDCDCIHHTNQQEKLHQRASTWKHGQVTVVKMRQPCSKSAGVKLALIAALQQLQPCISHPHSS